MGGDCKRKSINTLPWKSVDCYQNREVTLQHVGPDFLNLTRQEFQTKCPEEIFVVGNTSIGQLGENLVQRVQ